MYEGDPYWRLYRDVSWRHMRPWVEGEHGRRALDCGCGTGYWGIRLARAGFEVVFSDLSPAMLEEARGKCARAGVSGRAEFVLADMETLEGVDDESIDLVCAQGDPLCCCANPRRALGAVNRVLRRGGVFIASVDNRYAGLESYLEHGDLDGLEEQIRKGTTRWRTRREEESFRLRAFAPSELVSMLEEAGFEVVSMIGKTILPLRARRDLLEDEKNYRRLLKLELSLNSCRELLGRASHLQAASVKRGGPVEEGGKR